MTKADFSRLSIEIQGHHWDNQDLLWRHKDGAACDDSCPTPVRGDGEVIDRGSMADEESISREELRMWLGAVGPREFLEWVATEPPAP